MFGTIIDFVESSETQHDRVPVFVYNFRVSDIGCDLSDTTPTPTYNPVVTRFVVFACTVDMPCVETCLFLSVQLETEVHFEDLV